MTTNSANRGPQISVSQQIGQDADSAFRANKPVKWSVGDIGGDDFGVDFQATAFGEGDVGAQFYFNIQLKGTTQQSARSADGAFVSYAFDRTTLNLWHNGGSIIFVVLADLIETRDPKHARVHFLFASPELDEVLPTLPAEQKTLSLRVPTTQVVHRDLDIVPQVNEYLDELRAARALVRSRRRALGTISEEVATLASQSRDSGASAVIAIAAAEIDDLIEALPESARLRDALHCARSGDYERVLLLAPLPTEGEMERNSERAAIQAYLRSLAHDAMGDSEASNSMVDLASRLMPTNDVIAARGAQKKLDSIDFGAAGAEARRTLLAGLPISGGVAGTIVRAKLLALEGEPESARAELRVFPYEKIAVALPVISIVSRSWSKALTEIDDADRVDSLRERQKLWLRIMRSRALFELALDRVERPRDGELVVPPSGLQNIDYVQLRAAYESCFATMMLAQRLNWPADLQYVADVFAISSTLLGHGSDALPWLSSFAFARPRLVALRELVSKLSVQLDQPNIALQLSSLSQDTPKFPGEDLVLAVAAYKAGDVNGALGYVTDELLASTARSDIFFSSLLMLGVAANSALRTDLLEKIRERLSLDPEGLQYRAILDFAADVARSVLRRSDAVRKLHAHWQAHGRSPVIGYHLLVNADPTEAEEARVVVEIANDIERASSLGAEHLAQLGRALMTLEQFQDAVDRLRSAGERYRDDPEIKSLLGIALELSGRSSEAFQLLESLLASGSDSETARRYYVNIAIRMGFFDRAEKQVRAAYSVATSRRIRLKSLNTLFQLLLASGTRPGEVEEVAWEYGVLCDQDSEREEGIFLQQYLVATLPHSIDVETARIEAFRERLDRYIHRYPKSKYLASAQLPTDGPPEAFVQALQSAVGISADDLAREAAVERQMDQGSLHVPFSWRPRRFLRNVTDVFMLWKLRRQAPLHRGAFHFQNSADGYVRKTPDLRGVEPVLSLTSLLLLDEIGLIGTVLACFDRVVVARSTVLTLQEARSGLAMPYGSERATRITRVLQENFQRIVHPRYHVGREKSFVPDWHAEEKVAMEEGRRVYFCDDIIETFMVCGEDKPSMSLLEFAMWADESVHILTPQQVAEILAKMVALKVGAIAIRPRYFIAAIPDALQLAKDEVQEQRAFAEATALRSILDGVWDSSKSFEQLRAHFVHNMSYLIREGAAAESVLAALWLRWLQAVRLQRQPALLPLHKLASSFVAILRQVRDDRGQVSLLWQSFWSAIKRGLAQSLEEPEDRAGVRIVATALGSLMAESDTAAQAGQLFHRAGLGFTDGTALSKLFNDVFVQSAADQAQKIREKNG